MRKLTITRVKSIIGCGGTLKVYVTDPKHNQLDICGYPCRKLGEIKNGHIVSFNIDDVEGRVFVISDRASRDWCNDSRPIPKNSGDIELIGKCCFAPFLGNPFTFANKPDEEAMQNRKKGGKKGFKVAMIALAIGVLLGVVLGALIF